MFNSSAKKQIICFQKLYYIKKTALNICGELQSRQDDVAISRLSWQKLFFFIKERPKQASSTHDMML
jgi:hypothetical protein